MGDLATVLELLTHERPEVRKRAVDILAVTSNGDGPTTDAMVAAIATTTNIPKLLILLTAENHLLHGTLLMTLVNLCASKAHGTEAARVLCECQCIPRLMRLITAADPPPEAVQDLMLMLLTNITSVAGSIASNSLLQMEAGPDTRGYYLEGLLNKVVQKSCSATTGKWILNIVTNVTSEEVAQTTVMGNVDALDLLCKCLIMCDPVVNTYYALSIYRNIALGGETHHPGLISAGVPQLILENLKLDRPEKSPDMISAYVEFIYFLCTSKVGVEFMESINGKSTLTAVVQNESHTLRTPECERARAMLEQRLLNVLDDIQDVVVTGDTN